MTMILRIARWLLISGAIAYCVGVIALLALERIAQHRWWVALASTFAPLWFAPLLLLVPASLFVRSWWMRAAVAIPLGIFLLMFGARFIPPLHTAAAGGQHLRVATFNQRYDNTDVAGVVAAIRAQQADVVALQELSPAVASALAELKDQYPYQLLDPAKNQAGMGIISRYPIEDATILEDLRGRRVTVNVNGTRAVVVNAHLHHSHLIKGPAPIFHSITILRGYDTSSQQAQAQSLVAQVRGIQEPLIVLGDFNTGDREPAYATIAATLRDAYRDAAWGFGFTFPNNSRIGGVPIPFPLVRIDYVWTNAAATPTSAHVACVGGGDHCLVVADLQLGTS